MISGQSRTWFSQSSQKQQQQRRKVSPMVGSYYPYTPVIGFTGRVNKGF
jgi:hypothetical protein